MAYVHTNGIEVTVLVGAMHPHTLKLTSYIDTPLDLTLIYPPNHKYWTFAPTKAMDTPSGGTEISFIDSSGEVYKSSEYYLTATIQYARGDSYTANYKSATGLSGESLKFLHRCGGRQLADLGDKTISIPDPINDQYAPMFDTIPMSVLNPSNVTPIQGIDPGDPSVGRNWLVNNSFIIGDFYANFTSGPDPFITFPIGISDALMSNTARIVMPKFFQRYYVTCMDYSMKGIDGAALDRTLQYNVWAVTFGLQKGLQPIPVV